MAGFFKVLWRINAVLVFLALVAAIAFLALVSKDRIAPALLAAFNPPSPASAPVTPKPVHRYALEKDLLIGADLNHEDFEVYRLVRWGRAPGKPATPETAATVNLLVVDKKSGVNQWLFGGFDRAIRNEDAVLTGRWYWHEPEVDDDVPVDIVVLTVIETDSNGDGVLGGDDRQSLYVARFGAGVPPEKLLTADAVWFTMQKAKEYQIGYRDHGEGFLATYALPDFKLVAKTKVEGMPN